MNNQDQLADAPPIDPYQLATHIANQLTQAWNAGDGQAFAQPFAEQADFVTVFGELLHSRQAIGDGHDLILNTIFTGTQLQYTVRDAVLIDRNTVLVHVSGNYPCGKGSSMVQGGHATITLVIQKTDDTWRVRAFHNTMVSSSEKAYVISPSHFVIKTCINDQLYSENRIRYRPAYLAATFTPTSL